MRDGCGPALAYPTRCLRHCGRLTPVLDPRGGRPHPWLVWVALHTPRHSNRSALGRLFIPLFCHPDATSEILTRICCRHHFTFEICCRVISLLSLDGSEVGIGVLRAGVALG